MTLSYNHIIGVFAFTFLAFTTAARTDATTRFLSVARQLEEIQDPNNDYTARTAGMNAVRSQRGLSFCWMAGAQKYPNDSNSSLYHLQIVVRDNDSRNKVIADTTVIVYNDPDAVPNVVYFNRFPYFGETDSPYSHCT
ncbi:hypothetical protein M5K25_007956 [Dendrobium thyrsiflorum]|uniref:Uncharacterized protein n=1 Tax=Dendrobium thyrsiflorum TaxID=117978 RepID=A0ABD0VEC3_DENTH